MKTRNLTSTAALVAIGGVLLTGCGSSDSSSNQADSTPADIGVSPAASQNMDPDMRNVSMLRVIDGNTLVVTPVEESDPRFGQEITMDLVNTKAPSEGECGFEESKEHLTKQFKSNFGKGEITDASREFAMDYTTADDSVPTSEDGHQIANIQWRSGDVRYEMLNTGMATYVDGGSGSNHNLQAGAEQAKAAGKGLWSTCPGFGK